jgi:bacillithiol biosynthesis deacetylase BshB1
MAKDLKLDILAFGAHPDDTELGCGGSIIKHIKQGKKVGVIDLTEGQLGSRGSIEQRYKEAAKAAKIQGLSIRENLGMEDGWFRNDKDAQDKVIEMIRKYKPEIVLANAISDRHPDHGRGANLVAEACFYSGLLKVETFHKGTKQEAWRPRALYHYIQDYHIEPDFVIDVSDYWDQKIEAVLAFSSQFYNPESNEKETPISSKSFMDFLSARARTIGRPIQAEYGEGFTCTRYMGVNDLFDLK